MARLTAPLLSLGASGTIAKSLVYATWKGIPYARVHVIPANPRSNAQKEVRGVFSTLNEMWKRMPQNARGPFIHAVKGLPLTARNKHIQENVKALIDQEDLNELVMSVAGGSAVIPANVQFNVETALHIITTCDAPTDPVGYTFTWLLAVAVLDGVPAPDTLVRTTYALTDGVTPYSVDITVPAAGEYQVAAISVFKRNADQKVFYSAAVREHKTVTE